MRTLATATEAGGSYQAECSSLGGTMAGVYRLEIKVAAQRRRAGWIDCRDVSFSIDDRTLLELTGGGDLGARSAATSDAARSWHVSKWARRS